MNKETAISIIRNSIDDYETLTKHDYIILYETNKKEINFIRLNFQTYNFMHLTGVSYLPNASSFYRDAKEGLLRSKDMTFKPDGSTSQKISTLPQLVVLPKIARMIADFDGSGICLKTDVLVGNLQSCVGFKRSESGIYIPNTALQIDMRTISIPPTGRILVTMSKPKRAEKYSVIEYMSKDVDIKKIDDKFISMMDKSLISKHSPDRDVSFER